MFEKIDGISSDVPAENIRRLMDIFPDCVVETVDDKGVVSHAIDFDHLRQSLGDVVMDPDYERYQMLWPGKKNARDMAYSRIRKTLRPVPSESRNFKTTQNILIEGDNLDALKLLQENYLGAIKMIYIDPPYNTGKDFIYKDKFTMDSDDYAEQSGYVDENGEQLVQNTESNGRFHSDWLSMIYPRLLLAKNMLSDDGVIFISIDDNEVANLKRICDEVFGEKNSFVNTIWAKANAQNDAQNIQKNQEYILGYAKHIDNVELKENIQQEHRAYTDEHGTYYIGAGITTGGAGGTLNNRPNLGYTIYYNKLTNDKIGVQDYDVDLAKTSNDESFIYKDRIDLIDNGYIPIRPPKKRNLLGCWTLGLDNLNQNIHKIHITDSLSVYKKEYVDDPIIKNGNIILLKKFPLKSIYELSSSIGTKELNILMDMKVFDNAKPTNLLKRLIKSLCNDNDIVLDFFAGSGTTAHAVIDLNAQDGRQRRCISVQLAEPTNEKSEAYKAGYTNIAEITKERIRRVGDKIRSDNADKDLSKLDTGFRVFKIDSANEHNMEKHPKQFKQTDIDNYIKNIKPDRTDLDLLFGCLLHWGLDLSLPYEIKNLTGHDVYCVYLHNDTTKTPLLMAYFGTVTTDLIHAITEDKPMRVAFQDTSFNNNDALKRSTNEIFKTLSPNTQVKVI